MSGIIKKKDGSFNFKSETELENFVYIHLDRLLNLSPIARQYRIGTEICDIVATDSHGNISIIELKNTEDRYIVQQLTRYYHGLMESKPKIDGINYCQPTKLIAIAPSFHTHNFIDKKYLTLNIDFFTFDLVADRTNGNLFLNLTDVETEDKYVVQIPDINRSKVADLPEPAKVEIDRNATIDYYLRLNYSSQLKIAPLSPDKFREGSEKYKSKCTKPFKVAFEFNSYGESKTTKKSTIIVKLPSKTRLGDFYLWCCKNLDGGIEASKAKDSHITPAGVFIVRITL